MNARALRSTALGGVGLASVGPIAFVRFSLLPTLLRDKNRIGLSQAARRG